MITHERIARVIMSLPYNEKIGEIQDYVIQQEKKDELLELYRKAIGNISTFNPYHDEIKELEASLNE